MAFLSLLPAVGAAIVWLPVVIYFVATGAVLKAVLLAAFCVLVIGLVDNLLRPLLVGKDTKLPDYVVLLSTIGGMGLFGLNGFVIVARADNSQCRIEGNPPFLDSDQQPLFAMPQQCQDTLNVFHRQSRLRSYDLLVVALVPQCLYTR